MGCRNTTDENDLLLWRAPGTIILAPSETSDADPMLSDADPQITAASPLSLRSVVFLAKVPRSGPLGTRDQGDGLIEIRSTTDIRQCWQWDYSGVGFAA